MKAENEGPLTPCSFSGRRSISDLLRTSYVTLDEEELASESDKSENDQMSSNEGQVDSEMAASTDEVVPTAAEEEAEALVPSKGSELMDAIHELRQAVSGLADVITLLNENLMKGMQPLEPVIDNNANFTSMPYLDTTFDEAVVATSSMAPQP